METSQSIDSFLTFEDLLIHIGGFGAWNKLFLLFCCLSCFLASFNHLSIIFTAFPPTFSCSDPMITVEPSSPSNPTIINLAIITNNSCAITTHNSTSPCTMFSYDQTTVTSSVVSEWDLICERLVLLPTLGSSYMLGVVLSILATGLVSDYAGRRRLVITVLVVHIMASFLAWIGTSYWMFLVSRMVAGGSIHSIWSVLFIIVLETTPHGSRTFAAGVMNFGWNVGAVLLALVAFLLRDWRDIQLFLALSSLVMLSYFVMVPESPRWLMDKGHYEEAEAVLRKIAKSNSADIDEEKFMLNMEQVKKKISPKNNTSFIKQLKDFLSLFFKMVKTPRMRRQTLLLTPVFFAIGFGTYGIRFAAKLAEFDLYAVVAIKGVCSFCTVFFLSTVVYDKMDRTTCLTGSYLLAGLSGMAFLIVPYFLPGSKPILQVLAQALFEGNYFMVDTYAPELYPTNIRNFAFNLMDSISKAGATFSPFITDLGGVIDTGFPPAVFGLVLTVSSGFFLFLPETRGRPLAQNVEAVETNQGPSIIEKWRK